MRNSVIEILDKYLNIQDYEAAEKHLLYWLDDAAQNGNDRDRLSLYNEAIGLYRKCSEKDKALDAAQNVLELLDKLNMCETVTAGTSLINVATAYNAFGDPERSFEYYKKAQKIYEASLDKNDEKLGGLYNNMALAAQNIKKFGEAKEYFEKALEVMGNVPDGNLESAITHCNLADLVTMTAGAEDGESDIDFHLEEAMRLLDQSKDRTDGYYAFVCDKCYPVFDHYGYFIYKKELQSRAEKIYQTLKNA